MRKLLIAFRGPEDPRVDAQNGTPGTIWVRTESPFGVFQKTDRGLSTNWDLIAGGNMDSFEIGGRTIYGVENIKSLTGAGLQGEGTNAATLLHGNEAYSPPTGKKLVLLGARCSENGLLCVGYADNDVGQFADPAELENPVYLHGDPVNTLAVTVDTPETALFGEVPAGKYPFIRVNSASNHNLPVVVFGNEEDA